MSNTTRERTHQLLLPEHTTIYRRILGTVSRIRTWADHQYDCIGCTKCSRSMAHKLWSELNNDTDLLDRTCPDVDGNGHLRRAPIAWTLALAAGSMRTLAERYRDAYDSDLGAAVLLAAVFGEDVTA